MKEEGGRVDRGDRRKEGMTMGEKKEIKEE